MRALFASLILVFLAACGGGPDAQSLRTDVSTRLEQALPNGVVELASFNRRGSQADTRAPSGETRRIVYFDAELRLLRDLDFGAWNAPGVAGLVSALGAGPKGIEGITSGGNKAGDIIRAHGTALYRLEDGAWTLATPGRSRGSDRLYRTHQRDAGCLAACSGIISPRYVARAACRHRRGACRSPG
jgi:hypothetical protein